MEQTEPSTPGAPTGLRERKKQRTREALLRVALELFTSKGYEQTTIDEIADAVEVSQRTFFRYFASKEEAAFAVHDLVESHFFTALEARPPQERPFDAMRNAVLASWDSISLTIEDLVPVDLYMRICQVIESSPALLAIHLRRSAELEDRIAQLIADREGLDMDTDPRPRVAVAAFDGVMRATGRIWGKGEDLSITAMRTVALAHLDQIGPALAGNWRTTDAHNM
ncbi:TetR family transcriptional regulator [Streptomyces sp. SID10853]|uniref:TetR/AcrR family transcriptional regulator n=1 Tax=Streptomyces sp. SID10853 TaxID=2706028 RepID=UPI0013C2140C|nr:TetR family transcriptional regulator [Streptomyces sp. SID10853]NDZ78214.1 TetR family transcriptional regulator [Streptomyces sp. SID10853]